MHTQVCAGVTRQGQGPPTGDIHRNVPVPEPWWLSTALLPREMVTQRAAELPRQPQALCWMFVLMPGRQRIGLTPERRDLSPLEVCRRGQDVALSACW